MSTTKGVDYIIPESFSCRHEQVSGIVWIIALLYGHCFTGCYFFGILLLWTVYTWAKTMRPLDSRTRTTTSTRFNLNFFRVFSKNRHPGNLHCPFFLLEKIALLSILKEVKPSRDRKMIKLVVEWRRLPSFPAKMTLFHTRALLSIEKIKYS